VGWLRFRGGAKRRSHTFCLTALVWSLQTLAIDPPQWDEFAKGEFIDTANVKSEGNVASAYIRESGGKAATLYEVGCQDDKLRVHSDTPQYVRVPVGNGQSVLQSDDGFRTVVPGSRNARIENAVCEIVAQREVDIAWREKQQFCERAKPDEFARVLYFASRLTHDEALCLGELTNSNDRPAECERAGIPKGVSVSEYLHKKGIYLECEERPGGSGR
jgi:hypothetical protein